MKIAQPRAGASMWLAIFEKVMPARRPLGSQERRVSRTAAPNERDFNDAELDFLKLSQRRFAQGRFELALEMSRTNILRDPDSVAANFICMVSLASLNAYDECIEQIKKSKRLFFAQPTRLKYILWQISLFCRGFCYQRQRKYKEAVDDLNAVNDLHFTLYTIRGIAKFESEDYLGASEDLNTAQSEGPKEFWCLLYLGRLELHFGNAKQALIYLDEAETLDSHNLLYQSRSFAHQALGRLDLAIQDCQKAYKLFSGSNVIRERLLELLLQDLKFNDSVKLAIPGLANKPNGNYVINCLSSLAGIGDLQEAINLLIMYQSRFGKHWRDDAISNIRKYYEIGSAQRYQEENKTSKYLSASAGLFESFRPELPGIEQSMTTLNKIFDAISPGVPENLRSCTAELIASLLVAAQSGDAVVINTLLDLTKAETTRRAKSISEPHHPVQSDDLYERAGLSSGAVSTVPKRTKAIGTPAIRASHNRSASKLLSEVIAPKLNESQLAAFKLYAAKKRWRSESGISPSKHISTNFRRWLGKGLTLALVREAQENLAGAYSTEISRYPDRRVEGLIVHPHSLPAGGERPPSLRRVAELSEDELVLRREKERAKSARRRAKIRKNAPYAP